MPFQWENNQNSILFKPTTLPPPLPLFLLPSPLLPPFPLPLCIPWLFSNASAVNSGTCSTHRRRLPSTTPSPKLQEHYTHCIPGNLHQVNLPFLSAKCPWHTSGQLQTCSEVRAEVREEGEGGGGREREGETLRQVH